MIDSIEVGQKLWYVPLYAGEAKSVSVIKIGRKWIELDNGRRVDKVRLIADGGGYSSPGTAYLSVEDYTEEQELQTQWRDFSRRIGNLWYPPTGVTRDAINQAAELIGLPLETKP